MAVFISLVRLFLFALSSLGTWEIFRRKSNINVYFLPSLTIAAQTAILFLAGLFNLLLEVTWLLYLLGFFGLVYSIYRDKGVRFLLHYCNVGFVFLTLVSCVLLVFLKGQMFTHYDNFSHWALVVQRMLGVNRFPNFEDTIIGFTSYPLGSATYIYYLAKLVSNSESVQMFAQAYMMLACIIPLFVLANRHRVAVFITLLAATNFIFAYNITITNLLVDTLLPLVGACGLFFVYQYCTNGGRFELYCAALYMVQLMQIKNSGLFFVALMIILILIHFRNGHWRTRIFSIIAPFASLVLWQRHCSYVFSNSEMSKHAMTVENYSANISSKTWEDIQSICSAMVKFIFTWKDVWLAFAVLILVGLITLLVSRRMIKLFLKLMAVCVAIYLVYQVGMLAMYLFSMPMREAATLASSTRYTKTILIFLLYFILAYAIQMISSLESRRNLLISSSGIVVAFFAYMYFAFGSVTIISWPSSNSAIRSWVESVRDEYALPNGDSYSFLASSGDASYMTYLGRYVFRSTSVKSIVATSPDDLNKIDTHYIIVFDQDNAVANEWIRANYPDQYGSDVIVRNSD
ncbi:MAG TPA: hypothetical protein H9694_00510 [Firmicutes bacterium]|nr:hypothetical protein [Bacillota bacterium]